MSIKNGGTICQTMTEPAPRRAAATKKERKRVAAAAKTSTATTAKTEVNAATAVRNTAITAHILNTADAARGGKSKHKDVRQASTILQTFFWPG